MHASIYNRCVFIFIKQRDIFAFYRNLRFLYFSWISWFSGNSSISRKCLIFSWWNEHLLDKKCSKWQSKVDTLLLGFELKLAQIISFIKIHGSCISISLRHLIGAHESIEIDHFMTISLKYSYLSRQSLVFSWISHEIQLFYKEMCAKCTQFLWNQDNFSWFPGIYGHICLRYGHEVPIK